MESGKKKRMRQSTKEEQENRVGKGEGKDPKRTTISTCARDEANFLAGNRQENKRAGS